jgi:transcriptional regulator
MYTPKLFEQKEPVALMELIRSNPFATVVSMSEGLPFINHLPIIAEQDSSGAVTLIGHMARANPQWQHFRPRQKNGQEIGQEITVVFHGPHTYITPSWYKNPMNVPTWNYAVAHAFGVPKLIEDADGIDSILKRTVQVFEGQEAKPWTYNLPTEFKDGLVRAIIGFEIPISRFESKFKMSQNREDEDYKGVLEGLKNRQDEMSKRVLDLMLSLPESNSASDH